MPAAWIEASRPPLVPGTSAHASSMTPLVLWLVHISWTTTYIVLAACALVAYLSIKGRSITWLVRRGKSRLRGHRMASRPLYYRRRAQLLRSYDELPLELLRGGHQ